MTLPDFSLIETVSLQARLIRTVVVGGEELRPDHLIAVLHLVRHQQLAHPFSRPVSQNVVEALITSATVEHLVSQTVFDRLEKTWEDEGTKIHLVPGDGFEDFLTKLNDFQDLYPDRPLKGHNISFQKYEKIFPPVTTTNSVAAQLSLF